MQTRQDSARLCVMGTHSNLNTSSLLHCISLLMVLDIVEVLRLMLMSIGVCVELTLSLSFIP